MEYAQVDNSSDTFAHSTPWSPQFLLSPSNSDPSQNSPIQAMFPQHASMMLDSQRPEVQSSSPMRSRPQTAQLSLNLSALSVGGSRVASAGGSLESPVLAMQRSPTEPSSPVHNITPQQAMFSQHGANESASQSQAHSFNGWYDASQQDPSQPQSSPRTLLRTKRALPPSMDEATLQETMHPNHHPHMLQYPNAHPAHPLPVGLGISHSSSESSIAHNMGIHPSQVLSMDDADMSYGSNGMDGSTVDQDQDDGDVSPDSASSDPPESLNLISQTGGTGVSSSSLHGGIKLPSAGLDMMHSPSGYTVIGRPPPMNNFVTKLYNMILDPKASPFISWTELGASFVVSSITEFSRTILGSHFKHNNFSSFVRQLNMYGFHKINRTPRASRSSTADQTWEFSHPKFLRGRPDLLDEIKRKALEPDMTIRQRIELPAEVAGQLGRMEGEVRHLRAELENEKEKSSKLAGVVKCMWDWLATAFPGQVPISFPADLIDSPDHPPIFITAATDNAQNSGGSYLSPLSGSHPYYSMPIPNTLTPQSTPTSTQFPDEDQQRQQHHHQQEQHMHEQLCDARTRFIVPQVLPIGTNRYMRRHLSLEEVAAQSTPQHPMSFNLRSAQATVQEGNEGVHSASPDEMTGQGSELPALMPLDHASLNAPPTKTGGGSGRASTKRHRPNPAPAVDTHASASSNGDTLSPIGGGGTALRKLHRARSDSAPLGYGLGGSYMGTESGAAASGGAARPRSGTNIARRGAASTFRSVPAKLETGQ